MILWALPPLNAARAGEKLMTKTPEALIWPALTKEHRPWTRWWWMGSAVSEGELTRHMELFQEAGLGGVEISPIYAVQGRGDRNLPFLSPRWVQLLRHTVREARRRDMGVDMITGTGWPFGGPWVGKEDAATKYHLARIPLDVQSPRFTLPQEKGLLVALTAVSTNGATVDLTKLVEPSGEIRWKAPTGESGEWTLYALRSAPTGQQVKRASPGGEGPVLDPFSESALRRYLAPFDRALSGVPPSERVRAYFNDSFEAYGANGTPDLPAQFERRRGYDLRRNLHALAGHAEPDLNRRVRSDFRQTVSELLLEGFTETWTDWAHRHGAITRNQAHGSPGNLLDLYAAADIPETEAFGTAWLELAGRDPLPGTPPRHGGRAELLACKMASSAAHVAGKPLCSTESMTWLGEHFKVPPDHLKAEADLLFLAGVNHLFYHGTPFSPADAGWPGWLFYASTHIGPTQTFWRDLPALNAYIARCQSFLQAGRPDNDLLVYLPIYDLWASDEGSKDLLQYMTVHNTENWLDRNLSGFTKASRLLWDRGYGFDFVSDRLLKSAVQLSGSRLKARGGSYRALVVAGCTFMPPETLEHILSLARGGATVLVLGELPRDIPGWGDLEERRRRFQEAMAVLKPPRETEGGISERAMGQGRLIVGADLEAMLRRAGVPREELVDRGIEFVRRDEGNGSVYFLANLGRKPIEGWIPLSVPASSVGVFDPMQARRGVAEIRKGEGGRTEVALQMDPGQTLVLRTRRERVSGPSWPSLKVAGEPRQIEGEWSVEFIEGGPALPTPARIRQLDSWTEWGHLPEDQRAALRAFSGTARYRIAFDMPDPKADGWILDLGEIRHSARVRLNGRNLGTVFSIPYRLSLDEGLREGRNEMEIEVTNLMANRIAEMDRRNVPWKNFFFVNIHYKAFDAGEWEPLPSGLLGPVRLLPLRR